MLAWPGIKFSWPDPCSTRWLYLGGVLSESVGAQEEQESWCCPRCWPKAQPVCWKDIISSNQLPSCRDPFPQNDDQIAGFCILGLSDLVLLRAFTNVRFLIFRFRTTFHGRSDRINLIKKYYEFPERAGFFRDLLQRNDSGLERI
jgi:hypothetical protein